MPQLTEKCSSSFKTTRRNGTKNTNSSQLKHASGLKITWRQRQPEPPTGRLQASQQR
jgi:hypothetical protein